MAVTLNDVDHIAALARLAFTEEEKRRLMAQMNAILSYMDQLNKLDTSAIEPLSHVIGLSNAFREDVVRPGLDPERALANAPAKTEQFFKVPKVIGDR
jgi:aspartyl-tRNA(Asn)/glutamyl-tRNA(Gln) amidotransferase subunit C